MLSELRAKIVSLVPSDYEQRVTYFISDYQQVADQLRSLIYRTMCPMLIDQTSVSMLDYLSVCFLVCLSVASLCEFCIHKYVLCAYVAICYALYQLMNQLVEQSGWDQKKMREEPHEWVDALVNLCTEVRRTENSHFLS